jgi:hypothetical protein
MHAHNCRVHAIPGPRLRLTWREGRRRCKRGHVGQGGVWVRLPRSPCTAGPAAGTNEGDRVHAPDWLCCRHCQFRQAAAASLPSAPRAGHREPNPSCPCGAAHPGCAASRAAAAAAGAPGGGSCGAPMFSSQAALAHALPRPTNRATTERSHTRSSSVMLRTCGGRQEAGSSYNAEQARAALWTPVPEPAGATTAWCWQYTAQVAAASELRDWGK